MILPTPSPISLHAAVTATPTPIASPLANSGQKPSGATYIDADGVTRSIYYAGRSIVVSCAPNTTCRVELSPGSDISANLTPPTGWHVTPDNSGTVPMLLIIPDAGAPDTGMVVQTKEIG